MARRRMRLVITGARIARLQRPILRVVLLPAPVRLLLDRERRDATTGKKGEGDEEQSRGKGDCLHAGKMAEGGGENNR